MLIIFLLTAITTFLSILLVKHFFPWWGLLDKPHKYGHNRPAVPYPAGVIIPILFFTVAFVLIDYNSSLFKPLIGFFIASVILLITSFIDDRRGLSPFFRLGIQLLVAIIIIASGIGINEIRLPFNHNISLHWGSLHWGDHIIMPIADILAIIWILGMINTMNWLDGISGLTSSVSMFSASILAISAFMFGQHDVAVLFGVLAVICAVFFCFDLETPQILMGDSGSMFLGLSLAVFTIIAGGKVATVMLVMFAPLFDTVWTIARRIARKQSPFTGDLNHLHHKLLKIIKNRRTTVIVYTSFTAIFGFTALFFKTPGKAVLLIIAFILMFTLEWYLEKKM